MGGKVYYYGRDRALFHLISILTMWNNIGARDYDWLINGNDKATRRECTMKNRPVRFLPETTELSPPW